MNQSKKWLLSVGASVWAGALLLTACSSQPETAATPPPAEVEVTTTTPSAPVVAQNANLGASSSGYSH